MVGVETVEFLDHRDGMIEYGLPLRRDLARLIRRHRPEVILTLNFDFSWGGVALNQADHRAVGLAVCDAARDAANRWIFPELLTEGFEPWGGARWVFVCSAGQTTHYCDVGESIERGIASLEAHQAYFQNLGQDFNPDTFLRGSAARAGELGGCRYAVTFQVFNL